AFLRRLRGLHAKFLVVRALAFGTGAAGEVHGKLFAQQRVFLGGVLARPDVVGDGVHLALQVRRELGAVERERLDLALVFVDIGFVLVLLRRIGVAIVERGLIAGDVRAVARLDLLGHFLHLDLGVRII